LKGHTVAEELAQHESSNDAGGHRADQQPDAGRYDRDR
jgi:hypothetical protein